MVFKKPYAFFVKYFKVINLILAVVFSLIMYKMYLLNGVLNDIYDATLTNYSSLQATYLGFSMYLLMFIELALLLIVIILLKRKDKPLRDYLLGVGYLVLIFIFFLSVSNLFLRLESVIIEPASLKVYSDLSLLIMLPLIYLIFRYLMITIGFDIKKFNFTKDIIELKSEEDDNEEVELMFTKDSYKYKRGIRRYFREMKYYASENRLFIYIILGVFVVGLLSTFVGINIFNSSKVNINETFVAGTFSYRVSDVYETQYDMHNSYVKKGYKFVIANVNVRNNSGINSAIDFNRIRLFYDDEYVYANNYYNGYFTDLGNPYNNNSLLSGENVDYIFIFRVPNSYKSNKYTIKFYDKNVFEEEELNADYKVIKVKSKNLDKKINTINLKLNDKANFENKSYGNSNITIKSFEKNSSYKYKENNLTKIITPKNSNSLLLIVEYDLVIDKNSEMFNNLKKDKEFFNNFVKITYELNGKEKVINGNDIINVGIDKKIFINVPYNFQNAQNIKFIIKFRDSEYIYTLSK